GGVSGRPSPPPPPFAPPPGWRPLPGPRTFPHRAPRRGDGMRRRSLLTLAAAVACFAAAPAGPPTPADLSPADAPEPAEPAGALPTGEGFAALLRTDPVRAFEVVLKRCNEYHKYTCTM